MLKQLVKIANTLDQLGHHNEADFMDWILVQAMDIGYGKNVTEMASRLSPAEVLKALEWASGGDTVFVNHMLRWIEFQKKFEGRKWNFGSAPRPEIWSKKKPKMPSEPIKQTPAEPTMADVFGPISSEPELSPTKAISPSMMSGSMEDEDSKTSIDENFSGSRQVA